MIPYLDALEILRRTPPRLRSGSVPLGVANGRILSEALEARVFVPSFANAAMDGFALRAADTLEAPVDLTVLFQVPAGSTPGPVRGGACEIMTGAPVPEGCDAVVRVEDVTVMAVDPMGRPLRIAVAEPVREGANIRKPGEDYCPQDPVAAAGTRMTPSQIMACAALGIDTVTVHSPMTVGLLCTGAEVAGDPRLPLGPGHIRDANTPFLSAALDSAGAVPRHAGSVGDSAARFEILLEEAMSVDDLVLSTGGVSMGALDFVPASLERLGARIRFRKAAIKPGKPIVFASLPNGVPFLGLPGNPVSTAVGFRFFVWPLLERLTGLVPEILPRAVLAHDVPEPGKAAGLRQFQKARAFLDDGCRLTVRLLPGQESFKIHPFLQANCWAVLPENRGALKAGTPVEIASPVPGRPVEFLAGDVSC
ncbi:molybdopterin molybdotransferase MoeA [Phaeovibrio sulfidiphilus]|uniref:Molybdopterin molybdenumtransferase n=1 Tax=Phaeovibrio sulfidiphilus TaxID=1220600 RepID=A0A8J6YQE4_9PROT|nr:gephyrin-like molybdotransferase Glp [Phaeovibrio sulfidiphilus]MBE1237387.1 molybdopterin molybdotransferase MoeA [Phaeovibrio sulfidiphilus]